ncbi:TrbI/VirB10 family protein [Nevskia soli]|uniref:TrbI/VirB10 family protein n=1 Tax=Nevskia soli TaxID=418856 RepID=UPI000691A0F4|nr:TrbI/VirB10 family protein [Nevskia soli]
MDSDDRDRVGEQEPPRQRGRSPVAAAARNKIGTVLGLIGIGLVVAFLFLTGGKPGKPAPAAKPPVLANVDNSPPPDLPLPATERSFEVPNNPQHFETHPAGATQEAVDAAKQKAEARMHSPMLVFDDSGHEQAAAAPKPPGADPLNALLAAQLQNAAAGAQPDEPKGERSSPAEGYAERTQAFAKAAVKDQAQEAVAHRISLGDRIAEGKMLAATLETALSSDLPGKLRAVVTSDVWSEDGSRKLILKGSRLIGDYRSGLVRGQTRVFVIWTRLLEPDGTDVAIGSPGTDDLGRAGLTGDIDRHFVERFGAAFLLSLIGSATTASQGGNTFVINTSQGFGQVAQDSLQDSINIPPTIYVDQGTPVQVFVARDLVFGAAPQLSAGMP